MNAKNIPKEQIKGLECKHAVYVKAQDGSKNDLVSIKEQIHLKDGTTVPNVRFVENFKREFWVTKDAHRDHTDKLEWEDKHKVQKFTSTQINLTDSVARALGRPGWKGTLQMLARSPFLYGVDITTPVLIKRKYMDTYPECESENSVAVMDIETDVVKGHGEPLSVALTYKDRCMIAVTEEFLEGVYSPKDTIQRLFKKYLSKYAEERNIKLEVVVAKNPGHAISEAVARGHKWMPDFISFWNMDFDIPKMIEALEKYGYNPAKVFSDPSLPNKYQYAYYKQGPKGKLTATGGYMSLHPAEQWHTLFCPASFYVIDSMCVYKRIRTAAGMEPSYSLDAILNKELNLGKLRFDKADEYTGLRWHQVMQQEHKVEYLIYNLFDCIGVEILDETTKDLAQTVTTLIEHSEYQRFTSQPRRTCDDLHFFCLDNGLVIGSTSDQMATELDDYIFSMDDWIITMPTHLVANNGVSLCKELPHLRSKLRLHTLDLDLKSAYPHGEIILNISKETTYRELCKVVGVPEKDLRRVCVNQTAARVNAVEICQDIMKAPTLEELYADFVDSDIAV